MEILLANQFNVFSTAGQLGLDSGMQEGSCPFSSNGSFILVRGIGEDGCGIGVIPRHLGNVVLFGERYLSHRSGKLLALSRDFIQ